MNTKELHIGADLQLATWLGSIFFHEVKSMAAGRYHSLLSENIIESISTICQIKSQLLTGLGFLDTSLIKSLDLTLMVTKFNMSFYS